MAPTLILVSGLPASGKTTLAQALANELSLPYLGKDATLKEPMFDALDTTTREWSIKVGKAAFTIMQNLIEEQLKAGHSLVVESTFKYEYDNPYFVALQQKYPFTAVQVLCHADNDTLAQRFIDRIESGERHPGHGHDYEDVSHKALVERLCAVGKPKAFEIDGKVFELDTTDFTTLDVHKLIDAIREQ